jgi:hypothetical protein
MHSKILAAAFAALLPAAAHAIDCKAPAPSRASSAYWDYVAVCGCDSVDPVSAASLDYERWVAACAPSLREAARARELARALAEAKSQRKKVEPAKAEASEAVPAKTEESAAPDGGSAETEPAEEEATSGAETETGPAAAEEK